MPASKVGSFLRLVHVPTGCVVQQGVLVALYLAPANSSEILRGWPGRSRT